MKIADGITVANQLILKEEDYLGLSSGPKIIPKILKSGRETLKTEPERYQHDKAQLHIGRKGPLGQVEDL